MTVHPVGRSHLPIGRVMYFRAHLDIYRQLPPEDFSISINLIDSTRNALFRNQIVLENHGREIHSLVNRSTCAPLFSMMAALGSGNAHDLIDDLSRQHPSDFVRFYALKSIAVAAPDIDRTCQVIAQGLASPSRFIRENSRQYLDNLTLPHSR